MATANKTSEATPPLADLREEAVAHLESIKGELDEAAKDLDVLESIGLDVSRLRERVDWGYKAREAVINRFGRKA